ncbi:MAG: ABC-type Na+ efflux pump permease subunit [Halieaceae bacterium]|jgi:ABC-type Na+ efflux pump permease subunit
MLGFLVASMKKDLLRWGQERNTLLIWLGVPFLIGGLMTAMMDGDDGRPTGVILVADQDQSLLSGLFVGAYTQEQLGGLLIVERVSVEEGEERINVGEASGFLTIPVGFQDAFINETPVTLLLKTNPSQTILPGIIEDVTEILLDAGFYAQRLLGPEIRSINESGSLEDSSDVFVAAVSVDVRNKISNIQTRLSPPLLEIVIVEPPPTQATPGMALLFVPGFILMSILFSSNSLAADYWTESEKGTLRRLLSAPGVLAGFVAGKALAALAVFALLATILLSVGFAYHGIAWSKFLPSLLWVSLGGVALFSWFATLQMLFKSHRTAEIIMTALLFPLMMIGGSFFPLAALPDWIARISRLSPNGFMVDRLSTELTSASAWSIDGSSWLTLLGLTIAGLSLSTWRLYSDFARR